MLIFSLVIYWFLLRQELVLSVLESAWFQWPLSAWLFASLNLPGPYTQIFLAASHLVSLIIWARVQSEILDQYWQSGQLFAAAATVEPAKQVQLELAPKIQLELAWNVQVYWQIDSCHFEFRRAVSLQKAKVINLLPCSSTCSPHTSHRSLDWLVAGLRVVVQV